MVLGFGGKKMAQNLIERLREAATQLPPIESSSFGSHFDSPFPSLGHTSLFYLS